MIAFATLLLGLVLGPRPIEVTPGSGVASVEIVLDGVPAAHLSRSPWRASVDFGTELSPHELVARALDGQGREISVARQWINLPRPAAELQIIVERDASGFARTARLVWGSLLPGAPQALSVTLDGRSLAVNGREPFAIPAYNPGSTHLLSASAEFENRVRCRADSVLGGESVAETAALTAVPVLLDRDRPLPAVASLTGALIRRGESLRIVALERGPAQLLLVRDVSELEARARYGLGQSIGTGSGSTGISSGPRGALAAQPGAPRSSFRIGDDDRIRMIWPVARRVITEAGATELFETSRTFRGGDTGLLWLLTRLSRPGDAGPERRFADATAVAGLQALESANRRAVVLLLGNRDDESHLTPRQVRGYLDRIHVPLFVWSLAPPKADRIEAWGAVTDVSSNIKLRFAVEKLNADLEGQAIAWVEGRYLPQEITVRPGAPAGLEIAHTPSR